MGTQIGKDNKYCANCVWWDGDREFKSYATIALDSRGKCTSPKDFKRGNNTDCIQNGCANFERDPRTR